MKTYEISPRDCLRSSIESSNGKLSTSRISNYDTFQETSRMGSMNYNNRSRYSNLASSPRQKNAFTNNYYTARANNIQKEPRNSHIQFYSPVQLRNVPKFEKKDYSPKIVRDLIDENKVLQCQRDSAAKKFNIMKETIDSNNQSQSEIEYKCEVQTNKLDVANAHVSELKDQQEFLRKKYEDAAAHIHDLEEQNKHLKKTLTDANEKITRLEHECNDLSNENKALNNAQIIKDSMISNLQKEKETIFNDLTSQLERHQREKNNEIREYINEIHRLENQKETLNTKVLQLNNQLDHEKLLNIQKDKLIPTQKEKDSITYLFNFYSNIKDLLLKQTANKDQFLEHPDELRRILNLLEEKIRTNNSNYVGRMGKCFPCDIACCVSSTERRKYFLNKSNV